MDFNNNLTNYTNNWNLTNENFNFNNLNTYINSGFLFVILCINLINLCYNNNNLKNIKDKLNKSIWMKEIYDKIFNQYAWTDKITDKKQEIIKRRNSKKEISKKDISEILDEKNEILDINI